jgi:hypothetical protein
MIQFPGADHLISWAGLCPLRRQTTFDAHAQGRDMAEAVLV